jgi:hypothetical protein
MKRFKQVILTSFIVIVIIFNLISSNCYKGGESKLITFLKSKICFAVDSLNKMMPPQDRVYFVFMKELNINKKSFSFTMSYILSQNPIRWLYPNPSHILYYSTDIVLIRFDKTIDTTITNNNFKKITEIDKTNFVQKLDPGIWTYEPYILKCQFKKDKFTVEYINDNNKKYRNEYKNLYDWDFIKIHNDSLFKLNKEYNEFYSK